MHPEYSLEVLMMQLKLQYFDHLMRRADSLEETPILGNIEKRRRWQQRLRWLDSIINTVDMSLQTWGVNEGQGCLACCSPWSHKEPDMTAQLNNSEVPRDNNFNYIL